jgi:SAM-dependent methyltransferase
MRQPVDDCVPLRACRGCQSNSLSPILDLGDTPLANRLLTAEQLNEPEPRYPLRLVFCPQCGLVQIDHTVRPDILFRDYVYMSSFSPSFVEQARRHAEELMERRQLDPQSLVVEAASNDGYLLKWFAQRGVPVLGIEPARNIAVIAREAGVATIDEFFDSELARRLAGSGQAADVFLAKNVLAHVADLNDFVRGIHDILKPSGIAEIEAPYLLDMLEHCEFDTIYHEHLCYFSLTALRHVFERNGLRIIRVKRLPVHGGSIRFTAACADGDVGEPDSSVVEMLAMEHAAQVTDASCYASFALKTNQLRTKLRDLLSSLKSQGKSIAAYGASAKGSTLLNYFGLGRETIDFIVDRNTGKQGRFAPGSHLPILPPETLVARQPDYVVLLTWNFAEEILEQQAAYRAAGGRFIVPVGEMSIL